MAKLSEDIAAELAFLNHALPQDLIDLKRAHSALLEQLGDFARDYEQATQLNRQQVVPLWGGAGAAARLYKWLGLYRRRPIGMPETASVTALRRQS